MVDLRRAPRFDASAIPSLKSAHQIGGPEIKLINISRGGALIEVQERLSPGTSFALQLVTAETVHLLHGRIIRCYVYAIGKVVQYRCAIAFDEDFTILPPGKEAD
jgi:hypothetical protein